MIISSWNVNSVRARIENIKDYIKKFTPDVLMMQEIKTPDETYPYDEIKSLNYENYVFGQKSYNGVAIISKKKLIHAYGPMKKTVIMGINQTIKKIEKTAKLKVIGIKRL